ncbi:natriuretic peptide B precursor [Silurus asotus]|uniref:Natriuretic peptide B n=1 Tax=Silurus asotus TaxID=30991 RepID=A0AAD5ASC2_SILAS|nr:natriuretic peptide B precursor [Silurus asotus]
MAVTSKDLDDLKLLLSQLEELVPAQTLNPEEEETVIEEEEVVPQPEVLARDFLSARDLKTVRQDSGSKKYSGCFGRPLDRIGSMSTLGCKTIGRTSPKSK